MNNLVRTVLAFLLATGIGLSAAADSPAQKSSDRGVTVVVIPQGLTGDAGSWDFKIVLDTHSAELSDDLMKSAVLVDASGAQYTPVAWVGAGPGGHHREGMLRFKPISPRPDSIELRITRPDESAPRSFRWQLK